MTHPNCDKLVKALADMLNAIRTCNIDSPEIGDASTGNHKWHEEWAHLAEQALASHQSAPSTPTDEKRAALDALEKLANVPMEISLAVGIEEIVKWAKANGRYRKLQNQPEFDLDDGTDKPNEGGCLSGWCGI